MTRGGVSTGRGPVSTGRGYSVGGDPTSGGGGTTDANYIFLTEADLVAAEGRADNGGVFASQRTDLVTGSGFSQATVSPNLRSVMDDNGEHEFYANTNSRHDYGAMQEMSDTARDCALTYWFREYNNDSSADGYAVAAIDQIHHWFLDSATYQEPDAREIGAASPIEQFICVPAFIYAAALTRGHPHWDTYDGSRPWDGGDSGDAESAFGDWLETWYGTLLNDDVWSFCFQNNKIPWEICNRAAIAAYLEDDAKMDFAKQYYRGEVLQTCQYGTDEDGDVNPRPWGDFCQDDFCGVDPANAGTQAAFNAEVSREEASDYVYYNLLAHELCLLIFDAYDETDLWSFVSDQDSAPNSGVPSLKKALDWDDALNGVTDRSSWSLNEGGIPFSDGNMEQACSMYELAHTKYGEYADQITNADGASRPHWEDRVVGPITLTHGSVV